MTKTLPKPNVELLDQTLAEVRRAARRKRGLRWSQDVWRRTDDCGTTMCFAGWAVELSGRQWVEDDATPGYAFGVRSKRGERASMAGRENGRTVKVRSIPDVARELLGVTPGEADALFYYADTLRDLSRIVREIKQRA